MIGTLVEKIVSFTVSRRCSETIHGRPRECLCLKISVSVTGDPNSRTIYYVWWPDKLLRLYKSTRTGTALRLQSSHPMLVSKIHPHTTTRTAYRSWEFSRDCTEI